MVLAAPEGVSSATVRRLYLRCHRIEVCFQRASYDRSSYRAKTINGHVLAFTAAAVASAVASLRALSIQLGLAAPPMIAPLHLWTTKVVRRDLFAAAG